MNKVLAVLAVIVSVLGLSACNTVEGFGKDLSKLGGKIENKAEEKKSY